MTNTLDEQVADALSYYDYGDDKRITELQGLIKQLQAELKLKTDEADRLKAVIKSMCRPPLQLLKMKQLTNP